MDNKRTVMICLEKMGIGGVETVVLNQIITFIKKDFKVIVVAKKDIYTSKFEEMGAKCFDFEFTRINKYDNEKIKEISNIIISENVEQVHIHSIENIMYLVPACLMLNVPYVAYIHAGNLQCYTWYINNYEIYECALKNFFFFANKIVAMSETAKNIIVNSLGYDVAENVIVMPNSIILNENIKNTNNEYFKNNFLIVSRISKDKEKSVTNAIDLFKEYYEKYNINAMCSILGDGNDMENVKEYVKNIGMEERITFLGQTNDVNSQIEKCDILLGMGRCIIEAISMKKIAIISGYKNISGIVKEENIENALKENFTDRFTDENNFLKVLEELFSMTEEKMKKILEENYIFAYNRLNLEKNLYIIEKYETTSNFLELFCTDINKLLIKIDEQKQKVDEVRKEESIIYNQVKEDQQVLQEKINNMEQNEIRLEKNIKELSEENVKIFESNISLNKEKEELNDKIVELNDMITELTKSRWYKIKKCIKEYVKK